MIKSSITDATYPWWISPYKKSRSSSHAIQLFNIVSSSIGTPLSGYSPLSEANCKSYPPLSESYPNWSKQIVINTLKWRCYVSYYTKSTENIINNTLFTFRLNSVFFFFFFNWDSPHARLNSHYEAWSYNKKKEQRTMFTKNLQLKNVC